MNMEVFKVKKLKEFEKEVFINTIHLLNTQEGGVVVDYSQAIEKGKQFIQETIDEAYREAKKEFINKLPEHCFGCENRKRPCTGLHIAEILLTQDKKEL